MKKVIFAVIFTIFLVAGSPIFAQEEEQKQDKKKGNESIYYYKNLSLEKIFMYRRGYVVQYRRGPNRMGRAYLPHEWFTAAAGKGEIINLPPGNSWPSMSVYYKEGEFSHVRLYVHRSPYHLTWGALPQNVNIDSYFENVEVLELKF
ncbi:MAG: hypothetical protein FWC24_06920 [Treponema sp.]|nr:hypothetical protein [Treponema sp.]